LCCLSKESVQVRGLCKLFVTNSFFFIVNGCSPTLEVHPLSFVHGCWFNIFEANLHSWKPFVRPQPEDVPCCDDRDPHLTLPD
jgi:hypothetical protein